MIWIGKDCYRPSCSTPVLKQDHLEQVVPDRQKNLVPRFFWRSPRTLWPFIRVSPVAPYLSRAREPQTGHCSRLGFTSAEQRGLITSDMLAMFCLMQARIPSAFFAAGAQFRFVFSYVPTRNPRSPITTSVSTTFSLLTKIEWNREFSVICVKISFCCCWKLKRCKVITWTSILKLTLFLLPE